MRDRRRRPASGRAALALLVGIAGLAAGPVPPAPVPAQVSPPPAAPDSGIAVEVVPGARYRTGFLGRLLHGDNRRDLWLRPLQVQVLDLDRFGGGLVPEKQSGNQSRTLHLTAPDGRTWVFRSTDKFVEQILPPDLQDTWTESLLQDYISVFHPSAGLVVPALHEPLGLLSVPTYLRVMPDDPRLGEFREPFRGMLGLVVERPNEGPGDRPLYGGYRKIVGTEELLDKLEDHPRNRVDAREYLAARLLDFVVGDTDRGPDQWRWAREPDAEGDRWRPIPRDRDWAFMDADGLLAVLGRKVFPKLVGFDDELPSIRALTFADRGMGRRLLTPLDQDAWDAVVRDVQARLTDRAIRDAVARLPDTHQPGHSEQLVETLEARRDALAPTATAFYRRLATDVDVHATDIDDRAEVERRPDGRVRVTLYAPSETLAPLLAGAGGAAAVARPEPVGWRPYFDRTFLPDETEEVRVYMHGGDDVAVVRGGDAGDITVRVVGGGGDDALYDAAAGGPTAFYDDRGENRLVPGRGTRVVTRDYDAPEPPDGFFEYQLSEDPLRNWGAELTAFNPAFEYREGSGVVVGGGPSWTDYGFRRQPFASTVSFKGLVATATGDVGAELVAESRFEGRPAGLRLRARASRLDAFRFYGYGNDAEHLPDETSLVPQDRVLIAPSLIVESERWTADAGPVLEWTDPAVPAGNPAEGTARAGFGPLTRIGAQGRLVYRRVDHDNTPGRGVQISTEVAAFPGLDHRIGAHAAGRAEARGYVTLPVGVEPVLAVRVGGSALRGEAPVQEAARVGGRTTLRGYRWQRFAGDAAVYGGVELRVPLVRANLGVARGRLGLIALADAGRVYVDGRSPGGWHTAPGAGAYFQTLNTAVHVVWARGEEDRVYAGLGLPF